MLAPKLYDKVVLRKDVETYFGMKVKAGTQAVIVDLLGPDDGYILEFSTPDTSLVGGRRFWAVSVCRNDIDVIGQVF